MGQIKWSQFSFLLVTTECTVKLLRPVKLDSCTRVGECQPHPAATQLESTLGALKMREWKNRHGQNCRAGKCRSGICGRTCLKDLNIRLAFDDVKSLLMSDSPRKNLLQKVLRYVERQWIMKSTVDPQRLSVRDNPSHTNNVLESFHSALRS